MRLRGRRKGSGRFLATVLFVDIVGSTELASAIGDAAWDTLLGRYYAAVRDRLKRYGGRQIDTAGDGLFAAFDAPADGIACAFAIRDVAAGLGFATRAGLHMGEVQTIEGKVGGIAVHIGARIAGQAGPGEVLVSGTVRDLVEGSRLRLEDRGDAELKGVPGRWRLFVALPPVVEAADASAVESSLDGPSPGPMQEGAADAFGRLIPHSPWARGVIVAIIALVVVAIVGDVLLAKGTATPSPSAIAQVSPTPSAVPSVPVAANSLGRLDPATGAVASDAHVGAQPSGIAVAADGSIWVTNTTAGTVSRLDPTGTTVVQTINLVGTSSPTGITAGANAIWVAESGSRQVARISPDSNTVVKQYPVGNSPSGLAVDSTGQLWIADRLDGKLVSLDPDTGNVTPYTVGLTPMDVAFGAGFVWVSDYDKGTVVRVDPGTGAVVPVNVGNGASALAASSDAVWVANRLDGTVSHIDVATDGVVATLRLDGEPTGVAIGAAAVWVAIASKSELVKIDPATNAVVGSFPVGASPQAVAMAGRQPIFTAWAAQGNHMGGTLRVVSGGDSSYTVGSSDPEWSGSPLVPLTNDGLLSYRQVGGPDGFELVPDLATSIPVASDDGLTYVFTLRSNVRYSNGAPLKASDVLWSLERATVAFGGIPDILDQKALDACTAEHCDLSKQIQVDDARGTVTFHLTAADPFFLYDLALGPYIVPAEPAGTPFAESTTFFPATGPYMFYSVSTDEVVLKRNPSFQVWSPDAQPPGYPDEIDWRTVASEQTALAEVESGQADWLADELTGAQIAQLKVDHPDELAIAPSTKTWFEVMNTAVAPFDNLDVRRAINDVVDRQAVADDFGGGAVTCQVVPPAFAGYQPYCPYTSDHDSSQTWRGPGMTIPQAVSVIKQAGMYGKPVTIMTASDPQLTAVQKYFVGLLGQLGFKVTAKYLTVDQFFDEGVDTASPLTPPDEGGHPNATQMTGYYEAGQVPTASQAFTGIFTCAGFDHGVYADAQRYPQQFCDPAIDAMIQQATDEEGSSDPGTRAAANDLWAQIDKAVVDQAPAVFAFNPWDVNFFAKRVGNFQHQPVLNVLLDQLWVQ